jgi:hypothetical protein
VVIHLDLPWTAARLEQRTGRVARIGSPHGSVYVHTIMPPASARDFLATESIITAKWTVGDLAIGSSAPVPFASTPLPPARRSIPSQTESFRSVLERWRSNDRVDEQAAQPFVASVESSSAGFIAAVRTGERIVIVCSGNAGVTADLDTLIDKCASVTNRETMTDECVAQATLILIYEWISAGRASELAGLPLTSEVVPRPGLLDKIDAMVRRAAPHVRPALARLAVAARATATRSFGVATEHELDLLHRSELPATQWLQAVADFSPMPVKPSAYDASARGEIIAVLLLTPPPASEYEAK